MKPSIFNNPQYLYSEDDINALLKHHLGWDEGITIIQHVALNESELLEQTLQQTLSDITSGPYEQAVIPLHSGNNHWLAMAIKKGTNNEIVISYNDPLGGSIYNKAPLIECINKLCPDAKINDLKIAQQTNSYDCGPFVVDNLIKMSQEKTILNTEEAAQQAIDLRASQTKFLVKHEAIIDAASAFATLLLENNTQITESTLVNKIFDSKFLSVEEKELLANNLLDNDYIKKNKSLTKGSLTTALASTNFIKQNHDILSEYLLPEILLSTDPSLASIRRYYEDRAEERVTSKSIQSGKSLENLQVDTTRAKSISIEDTLQKLTEVEQNLELELKHIEDRIQKRAVSKPIQSEKSLENLQVDTTRAKPISIEDTLRKLNEVEKNLELELRHIEDKIQKRAVGKPIQSEQNLENLQVADASTISREEALQKIKEIKEKLEIELKYIKGRIVSELMQIVKNENGRVDCSSPDFKEAVNSLLNSKAKEAPSFAIVEQRINKMLTQAQEQIQSIGKDDISAIKLKLNAERITLESQLSNNEATQKLINQRIKEDVLRAMPFFGENKDFAALQENLAPFIKLPDNSYSLLKSNEKRHPFCDIVCANAVKAFAIKGEGYLTQNSCEVNLTEDNLKNFEKAVTDDINSLVSKKDPASKFKEAANIVLNKTAKIKAELQEVKDELKVKLKHIKGRIIHKLMTVVKNNNGQVNCNSNAFQAEVSSLLYAQAKTAFSFAMAAQEFIKSLEKQKISSEVVNAAESILNTEQSKFKSQLSNSEEVKKLITKKIKNEALDSITFAIPISKVREHCKKIIAPFMRLPNNSYSFLRAKQIGNPLYDIVSANALKFFTSPGDKKEQEVSQPNYITSEDQQNLTPDNLKNFEKAVTADISSLAKTLNIVPEFSPVSEVAAKIKKDLSTTKVDSAAVNLQDKLSKSKIQEVEEKITIELKYIKGRIVGELMQIVKNENGRVDCSSPDFKEAVNSLLNSKAKEAPSFAMVEQRVHKMLGLLQEQHVNKEEIKALESKLIDARKVLELQLSNNEDMQALINQRVKEDALCAIPFFGGNENFDLLKEKVSSYVTLPDNSYSLLNLNHKKHPFCDIIGANALKYFATSHGAEYLDDKCMEKLTTENLEAFAKATNKDIDILTSREVTLDVSDLKPYILNTPSPDPIADYMILERQIHTPGLKKLYNDLQASQQLSLSEIEQKHTRSLLEDLAEASKLPSIRATGLPEFEEGFYGEGNKKPEDRSAKYVDFIKKYSELQDSMGCVAKCSAQALLQFTKSTQDFNTLKQAVQSSIDNFKNSNDAQSKLDFNRAPILYKGPDNIVKEITLQELQESKDIPLSGEQREFIASSWQQGTFRAGNTAIYSRKKSATKGFGMIFDAEGRGDIFIDASDGVKVHSIYSTTFAESPDYPEVRKPFFDSALSVDISNMNGDKFIPGCSVTPKILVNMHKSELAVDILDIPQEVKVTRSQALQEIENVKRDFVSGALHMVCSQYKAKDVSSKLSQEDLDTSCSRGWNSIKEMIGEDQALSSIIKELYSQNHDDSVIVENILDVATRAMSSEVELPPKSDPLTLKKVVEQFCKIQADPILREQLASQCLDLFFSKQQGDLGNQDIQASIDEEVASILSPLCSSKSETARLKKNVSAMVQKLVSQHNTGQGWSGAWKSFKQLVSSVIEYLTGKSSRLQKFMASYPKISQSLKKHLSAKPSLEHSVSSESINNLDTIVTSKSRRHSTGNINAR
ncbi:ulp1 protease family, C-terminal catalytic domain protein [Orientia chuto str. Dubai]|uniref:Ulp1 protease family, C-terminal catalytic domain protein n=1 Tax=Orientia chuto str. Dubai TaxID=1359168 RepID=A0A0F3MJW3_9RICK|nr:Ulp1 family isopeptidase [Candidatus Orientia mediorientalis]KJV55946.1 ulp1 protease family, C-terminal catalytic domain protein [Orientia chuto str. Dubai]